MHRCLLISEIASLICFHGFEGWAGRRSIISFAQTCRICYEPAVNVIWNEIPNLTPLLGLLPKETWEKANRRKYSDTEILQALQLSNWSSFEEHARRVRVYGYQYGRRTDIEADQYYALLLLGEHNGRPLLPNVETLYISSLNQYALTALHLVTTTKLKVFHCVPTYGKGSNKGFLLLLELFSELGLRYPALKKLVVDLGRYNNYLEIPSSLTNALYSFEWRNLTEIQLNPVTNTVIHRLPRLPALERIKINFSTFPDMKHRPISTIQPYESLYPVLKTVDLSCENLTNVSEYLKTLPKETRAKSISFLCQDPSEFSRWSSLCQIIEERCEHLSLEQLSVTEAGRLPDGTTFTLTAEHLHPLRSFNYLTRIKIQTQGILDLDDSSLRSLVLAWPRIQSLALVGNTSSLQDASPKVTLLSLVFIAEYCPDIESLYLLFDARTVPRFPPGDPPTTGRNLEYLNVTDSPISDSAMVARFLRLIFPNLRQIVKGQSQSKFEDPQKEIRLMKLWHHVEQEFQ